jgi:hypothetical protein
MAIIHQLPAALLLGLLSINSQARQAASSSTNSSVAKDCTGLKGAALRECQKIAKRMEATADGTRPEKNEPNSTDLTYIHHSSPIMTTEEQKAVQKARDEGKDPQEALKKLKKRDVKQPQ